MPEEAAVGNVKKGEKQKIVGVEVGRKFLCFGTGLKSLISSFVHLNLTEPIASIIKRLLFTTLSSETHLDCLVECIFYAKF